LQARYARISLEVLAVSRTVAQANTSVELEQAVPFPRLRAGCALLIEAHERAIRRTAERKEARRWTPVEDEILRLGFREGRSVGELAERLGRTPLVVKNRWPRSVYSKSPISGGLRLNSRALRSRAKRHSNPWAHPREPKLDKGPEIDSTIRSCDSSEEEEIDAWIDEMNRHEEMAAIAQQEHEERLDEWERAEEAWQEHLRGEVPAAAELAAEDAA
jgi:hypothetical protein